MQEHVDEAQVGLIEGSTFHGDGGPIREGPPQRYTMPDFLDWHMILDHELAQITRPETGVIGSVGFVGVGAAIGLAPSFAHVLSKINLVPPQPVTNADVATVGCFIGSVVVSGICLFLFGLSVRRNKGLAGEIRARKKQNITAGASSSSSA